MLRNVYRIFLYLVYFIGIWITLLGVTGCKPVEPAPTPSPASERLLTPYFTATSSPTAKSSAASPTLNPSPSPIPLPTATPVIYTVVANDTLIGISVRYAVPLEDLMAANPGLDPNFLTIGMTLTIPLEGAIMPALPDATPIPLQIRTPRCYPLANGDLQCLVEVENTQPFAVENVAVQITLQALGAETSPTQTAFSPLNLLPSGQKIGLAATFEGLADQLYTPAATLLTVIPVAQDDPRYLKAALQLRAPVIDSQGLHAQLQGSVALSPGQPDAATVWLAAFAYDENGNLVGFRKWIAPESLLADHELDFNIWVFSLGPPIHHLELLVEARP